MEQFYSLLCVMGMSTVWCEDDLRPSFDIVGKLPPEIAIKILRLLDTQTLVSTALVNKYWLSLCRMDSTLRERVHRHLHRERCIHTDALLCGSSVTVLRDVVDRTANMPRAFTRRNDQFKMVMKTNQGNAGLHPRPTSAPVHAVDGRNMSFVRRAAGSSQGAVPSFPVTACPVQCSLSQQQKHSSTHRSRTFRKKKTPYNKTVCLRL